MIQALKRLRSRAQVKRLRERARGDAYPRSYVDLCKTLVGHGDTERALEAAREGLQRFPHSEDLRDVLRHTWRQTKSRSIDDLRRVCEVDPSTENFTALASIYLECEEYDEALAVADEFCRRRPDAVEALLLQGGVLIRRFSKDLVASDARRGMVALQRVLETDDRSFAAHFDLARLHRFIGSISKALFHLYRALDIEPEHEAARALHDELIQLPLEEADESDLLRALEEAEGKSAQDDESARPKLSREIRAALLADLNRLSLLNGVTRAAFVNSELIVIGEKGECRILGEGQTDPLCEIARGFRRAASISSKRMGIGSFQSSTLTAGRHTLQFHAAGSTVILVESDDSSRGDVIRTECVNFVASCMRNVKGFADA